ncbi:MAG: hypothetical protein H0W13_11295 [Nitrospirales bacterium]|nr:hypothetical protein [Nitrospirales bacterium]
MFHQIKHRTFVVLVSVLLVFSCAGAAAVHAQGGTDFQGTVLTSDGKLIVKKDEGGTRFTFVVNDKTQFMGSGLKSLADIKKGDHVIVNYVVNGSQYVAQKVAAVTNK